ncbi:MAG: HAD family hydrolase [Anaerolineae bacterium]|nr:HAD family hydrolase [Thermoflexales bacterium]MDW8407340.1 HAD family hydrolase [Anaerolineae bacterium]
MATVSPSSIAPGNAAATSRSTDGRRFSAVLFDLDGTLRANQPEGVEAFIDYARQAGLHLTPEQIILCERATHRYWADGAQVADHLARFDERGFWVNYNRILLAAMGITNCDDCAQRIQDYFDDYRPVDYLFPEAPAVLRSLKEEGYILGLVSNRDGDLAPVVAEYGIAEFFDFTLSGGQAGSFKPDAGIFLKALEMAGYVPAHRALYVGDNYYADVLGALAVGIEALLIDPRDVFATLYDKRVKSLGAVLDFIRTAQP